jgi:hypothetical protein
MKNARELLNTGKLTGSFVNAKGNKINFEGLSGKTLDFALVEFEQTKVQEYISKYAKNHPNTDMNSIYNDINSSMNSAFAPMEVSTVMDREFTQKGIKFDFRKYEHRVILGKGIISDLWKNQ